MSVLLLNSGLGRLVFEFERLGYKAVCNEFNGNVASRHTKYSYNVHDVILDLTILLRK